VPRPEEVAFVGAQYHGKLTMVDRWLGELWRALDELGLWEETVVVLTTDHGHDLGQRGAFGKQWPHYDSHANIPLLVHHPHHPPPAEPHRALTSTVDLHATLLEALGGDPGGSPHSRSLMPLLRGETRTHREALLYGTWGQGVGCTDGEWTVLKSQTDAAPLYAYTCSVYRSQVAETDVAPVGQGRFLPGVDLPQWRIPVTRMQLPLGRPDLLFHRAEDPLQERDLWDAEPGKRREMLDKLRALLDEEGCPEEGYVRLGLSA
jgi:Arylsulfatase A and related enzymes